jgi:hypothetical protein
MVGDAFPIWILQVNENGYLVVSLSEYGHKLHSILFVKDNKGWNKESALTESLFTKKISYMHGELSADGLTAYTLMVWEDTKYHLCTICFCYLLSVAICRLSLRSVLWERSYLWLSFLVDLRTSVSHKQTLPCYGWCSIHTATKVQAARITYCTDSHIRSLSWSFTGRKFLLMQVFNFGRNSYIGFKKR